VGTKKLSREREREVASLRTFLCMIRRKTILAGRHAGNQR